MVRRICSQPQQDSKVLHVVDHFIQHTITNRKFSSTMYFIKTLVAACLVALPSLATTVSYDTTYDNSGQSLATVACSDGPNGLLTKGYSTFGSLRNFPNIGGAAAVGGWNSDSCGSCWQLTYNGKSIFVVAVDHADDGFNISQEAMDTLTNGQASQLGRIDASVKQVSTSSCKL